MVLEAASRVIFVISFSLLLHGGDTNEFEPRNKDVAHCEKLLEKLVCYVPKTVHKNDALAKEKESETIENLKLFAGQPGETWGNPNSLRPIKSVTFICYEGNDQYEGRNDARQYKNVKLPGGNENKISDGIEKGYSHSELKNSSFSTKDNDDSARNYNSERQHSRLHYINVINGIIEVS